MEHYMFFMVFVAGKDKTLHLFKKCFLITIEIQLERVDTTLSD